MEEHERDLHRRDMADIYIATAERYGHSAIFIHPNPDSVEETQRLIDIIREQTGDRFYIMRHGDATYSIPDGAGIARFAERMADEPDALRAEAQQRVDDAIRKAERWAGKGLDGFALCADYCFNTGPFLSPRWFADLITPYLAQITRAYRDMGYYVIKHTDGNIMPILDQLLQTGPHALHSLDPQGGVDIAEVKRRCGDKVCLIGNVNCAMLDTGTDDEVVESVRYALRNGMPGGGYIFSTSNCIYTGMPLKRYELMLDVWRREGVYD
jgi:uroporphyrinogen decarboxylase